MDRERSLAKEQKRAYRYSGRCIDNGFEMLESLQKKELPFVIRVKKPRESITFNDLIKGETTTAPDEVDSFVILRADAHQHITWLAT